jgi:hypothetical protein
MHQLLINSALVDISLNTKVQNSNSTTLVVTMLDTIYFLSDLIDSSLDILTVDEKLLAFKEIKIIFTRYDFDQLFPVGRRKLWFLLHLCNAREILKKKATGC